MSGDFYDLIPVVDGSEAVYTDFCHLTRRGNEIVAHKIADIVVPLANAARR